jgi:hypothetical protein
MDGVVADYEASLETYPHVPGGVDDPYVPPARGSGSPVQTYPRTDRAPPGPRSEALPDPDFSGAWSTAVQSSAPPTGRPPPPPVPDLGSGWGDEISIVHDTGQLTVERVMFVPREMQPLVRYRFALDGAETENEVTPGRTGRPPVSTTARDGNRLVVTTRYPFQDPGNGRWLAHEVTQTLWLQPASGSPFEPSLVVETRRAGVLRGPPTTNRTVYSRGYR